MVLVASFKVGQTSWYVKNPGYIFFSWSYPPTGQLLGWKPVTLRGHLLGAFIIINLSVIVILEIFSWISAHAQNGGGLAFANNVNEISLVATFGSVKLVSKSYFVCHANITLQLYLPAHNSSCVLQHDMEVSVFAWIYTYLFLIYGQLG
jgi:hypothetical protein